MTLPEAHRLIIEMDPDAAGVGFRVEQWGQRWAFVGRSVSEDLEPRHVSVIVQEFETEEEARAMERLVQLYFEVTGNYPVFQ